MLFMIVGKHIQVTDAIKAYAEEKTSKLPRYYNSINQIEVVLDGSQSSKINGSKISVEMIARAEHSKLFVVTETGDDAYRCIDLAVRKLERQLRRKKTRERNKKHAQGE